MNDHEREEEERQGLWQNGFDAGFQYATGNMVPGSNGQPVSVEIDVPVGTVVQVAGGPVLGVIESVKTEYRRFDTNFGEMDIKVAIVSVLASGQTRIRK